MATQPMACPECGETSGLRTLERVTIERPAAFTVRVEDPSGTPAKHWAPGSHLAFVVGIDVVEYDTDPAAGVTFPDNLRDAEWFGEVKCRECGWQDHAGALVPLQD